MKLTQASDYAFRIVLYLTKNNGTVVEADTIANSEKIPKRFLLKICRDLTKAGIIESVRGKSGGYRLVKPPEKITMKDVIKAVEGDIVLTRCQIDPEYCNKNATSYCSVHKVLCSIREILSEEFAKYNFAILAGMDRNE